MQPNVTCSHCGGSHEVRDCGRALYAEAFRAVQEKSEEARRQHEGDEIRHRVLPRRGYVDAWRY